MTAITLSGVEKRFGSISVLEDINLEVAEGEFVSIIGPSGCGKTTLLRLITGLEVPTKGEISIFGKPSREAIKARKIGVAFQSPALVPSRTAIENVELTLEIAKRKNGHTPRELLENFGLGKFLSHYPHQLSGGMQQRVAIASMMVHNPDVLLMDEPFGALDEITRSQMAVWLGSVLNESPKTTLFVTHSIDEAVILSDKVIVMSPHPGRIETIVDVQLTKPRSRQTYNLSEFALLVGSIRQLLFQFTDMR